jgi:hypothetical protein
VACGYVSWENSSIYLSTIYLSFKISFPNPLEKSKSESKLCSRPTVSRTVSLEIKHPSGA